MAIVLVRHGETAGNATRVVQPADTPLNEHGVKQAAKIAERIRELGVGYLLSSDQPRAVMTAEPIAALTGVTPEFDSVLQERNFGDLRGIPYAQLPGGNPFGPDVEPKNGETWAEFHARIDRAFELIKTRAATTQGNLVVVTHGLVVASILSRLVPHDGFTIPSGFANGSLSLLDSTPPYRLTLLNDTTHLGTETSKTNYGAA